MINYIQSQYFAMSVLSVVWILQTSWSLCILTVNNSNVGNWALTYLLYKIFTPLRYTVTIGCTTMAIKQLSKSGMVKPLSFKTTEPSKTTTPWEIPLKIERQTKPPKT
ncbi:hypothetical protein E2986_11043 [Frieseomelitta varia]|uniref:Uncharacterized protein n=1 Tax=Frieseomelitta varia TaxID=561572 RepID=A0A833RXY6_9HYME|nr:hypothetical protein E2986_11043 [Frieseomelitta varia]